MTAFSGTPVSCSTRSGQYDAEIRQRLGESFCPELDERLVDQVLAHHHVQQSIRQGRVGTGPELQVARGPHRGWRPAWIDDDQLSAVRLLRLEVPHDRRHRLGDVAADEQDGVGVRDVRERKRQTAIEPERHRRRGGRRRHAEAAVVVDVGGPECHPRELAEPVRLLVGQRSAAEHADGVGAVTPLHVADPIGDALQRGFPRHRNKRARPVAHERCAQTIVMRQASPPPTTL